MNKNNEFTSLLGEVPALTQDAEGQLRGGFAVFGGNDGIATYNNDGFCDSNTGCYNNNTCNNNSYCSGNDVCSNQKNFPPQPGSNGGCPIGPTGKPNGK